MKLTKIKSYDLNAKEIQETINQVEENGYIFESQSTVSAKDEHNETYFVTLLYFEESIGVKNDASKS